MTTTVHEIELEPLAHPQPGGKPIVGSILPVLGSVKVRVAVRVGEAQTSVGDLLQMKAGAVLALDRLVDQAVDVMVHEHLIARGTLVAVGSHFGVRITEPATASNPESLQ